MRSVYSSHIATIGYDEDARELHVKWDRGKTSIYSEVPPDIAHLVMNAKSVGEALNEHVKVPNLPHRYL